MHASDPISIGSPPPPRAPRLGMRRVPGHRSLPLVFLLGAASMGSSCNVALTKQLSKRACAANASFGCCSALAAPRPAACNATTMWTSTGCRGDFELDGKAVTCDGTTDSTEPEPCVPKPPAPPAPPTPCYTENNTAFACGAPCFCQETWNASEINSTDPIQYSDVFNLSLHLWQVIDLPCNVRREGG